MRAYQLSATLADEIAHAVGSWGKLATWTVGVQAIRAADSVGANLAEGFGRDRGPDRRRFFIYARGSLTELEHWVDRASARRLIAANEYESRIAETARLINGLIRSERAA